LYLVGVLIHDKKIIENPFEKTLSKEQIEDVINKITFENRME